MVFYTSTLHTMQDSVKRGWIVGELYQLSKVSHYKYHKGQLPVMKATSSKGQDGFIDVLMTDGDGDGSLARLNSLNYYSMCVVLHVILGHSWTQ